MQATLVARLEKRLGVRLIQRTTRKLRMTETGETYFHHSSEHLRPMLRCCVDSVTITLGAGRTKSV
jgi:DNA-binding transcriptional LysR family regulator